MKVYEAVWRYMKSTLPVTPSLSLSPLSSLCRPTPPPFSPALPLPSHTHLSLLTLSVPASRLLLYSSNKCHLMCTTDVYTHAKRLGEIYSG